VTDFRHESRADGTIVITAPEDFYQYTAPAFRDFVSSLLSGTVRHLIADLSETTHIDSVGAGVLVGTRRRVDERGSRFCVVVADEHVLGVLTTMGLLDVLRVCGSVGKALAAMSGAEEVRQ
jgi:anti-sigma B factor antagonist